jgi:hypothetical protein
MQKNRISNQATTFVVNLPPHQALSELWGAFSGFAEDHFHLWWLRFDDALALLNEGYENGPPLDLDSWEELLRIPDEHASLKPSPPFSAVQSTTTLRKATQTQTHNTMKANENGISTNSHLHLIELNEAVPTAGSPETAHIGWELLLASMQERNCQTAAQFPTSSTTTVPRAA